MGVGRRELVGGRMRLGRTASLVGVAVGAALILGGCSSGDDRVRTVLVDYVHDEVASAYLTYFPREVVVRPGDTVRFQQEWTGEPHTVTLGTMADEMVGQFLPLFEKYKDVEDDSEIPEEDLAIADAIFARVPPMMADDFDGGPINQNVAQPCFLETGGPPEDPMTPCTEEQQVQPPFDGRQSFYNSGFIDYRGPDGNVFEVPLSDDIAPGTYYYYCIVHGVFQNGSIRVVSPGTEIPSQSEVSQQARAEVDRIAEPMVATLAELEAAEAPTTEMAKWGVAKPLAGWFADDVEVHAAVLEFIPKQIRVGVGETVSWSFVGAHTVSFNPPDYFSQLVVEDDGTVIFSEDAIQPRGGPGFADVEPVEVPEGERPPPPVVEVGPWDGTGFLSSGLGWEGTYSVTFTEEGTYPYACLVHPQMVGTVVVGEG